MTLPTKRSLLKAAFIIAILVVICFGGLALYSRLLFDLRATTTMKRGYSLWVGMNAYAGMTVNVAGVQVVSKIYPPKDPKAKDSFGSSFEALTPFNTSGPGVSIALMVSAPKGGILTIDTDHSKLTSFVDDKGNALYDPNASFGQDGFGGFPKTSKDGKVAMLTVEGKIAPATGATKATAVGSIAVFASSKKTKHTIPKVFLKDDSVIKAGTAEFTISDCKAEGDGIELDLKTQTDLASIANLRFLDPKGDEIGYQRTSTSSSSIGNGKRNYSATYRLETKLGQVQMEIELWDDLKVTQVPFDVSVPLPAGK